LWPGVAKIARRFIGDSPMLARDIRHIVSVRPFRPIEVRTADGETYRIAHPEVLVSDSMTVILDGREFRFLDNSNIVSLRRANGHKS
jgi:hypothetical protein